MKLLPAAATLSCVVLLIGCGKQTAGPSEADQQAQQRLAEEQQAQQLSDLHEREAALDERERLLDQREQQIAAFGTPPAEQSSPPEPAQPVVVQSAPGTPASSLQTFYDALSPYGTWVTMAGYGYVWQPAATVEDFRWRPYTLGRWAYTDDGWTWVSDEPFGWITYHYGRWMRTHTLNWVWVPGDQWAPAWVSWRYGNDFVGWAPLPPEARFDGATGIQQWADQQYDLGASDYTFVPASDFGDDNMADIEVPPDQALPVYDDSTNVTNIFYDAGAYAIICYGPSYDFMRSKSRGSFPPPMKLTRGGLRTTGKNGPVISGTTLAVTAPRIVRSNSPAAPASAHSVTDVRLVTPRNPPRTAPLAPAPASVYQPPQRTTEYQAPAEPRATPPPTFAPVPGPAPVSADQSAPPGNQPPPPGMRIPSQAHPVPIPPDVDAAKAHDLEVIQEQQAQREAERQQEDAEAARAAQAAQAAQEQHAEEQRAEEAARAQRAAEEQAAQAAREQEAAASREQAARDDAARASQAASLPAATQAPAGRGQQ